MEPGNRNSSEMPYGKWTDQEMKIILKYLQESSAKEAAMAHELSKNLIERYGISEKPTLQKCKETNLSSGVKKANSWLNTGWTEAECSHRNMADVMEVGSHHLQQNGICDEITQSRTNDNVRGIEKSVSFESDDEACFSARKDGTDIKSHTMNYYSPSVTIHSIPGKSVEKPKKNKYFEKNKKKCIPKSTAGHLAAFQAERSELFRKKLEWDRKQHEKEMEISAKKLAMEEKWIKAEIDLTIKELEMIEKEIQREERLRILDLEKEERLKKYELELEYQNHY